MTLQKSQLCISLAQIWLTTFLSVQKKTAEIYLAYPESFVGFIESVFFLRTIGILDQAAINSMIL